jgi:HEAT repeat protein
MLTGARRRALLLGGALAALIALVSARALTSGSRASGSGGATGAQRATAEEERGVVVPAAQPAPPPRPASNASAPVLARAADQPPPPRAPDAGARATDALIAALDSKDDFVVLEAAGELAKRDAPRALPALVAIDIEGRPHAAPSVIDALGRLGGRADATARRSATRRLLALLAQERGRGAPESAGNVLVIYEALGRTLDPNAAPALEAELLDPNVTWAAKTVIVEALTRLRQSSSKATLHELLDDVAARPATDALEAETQRELSVAAANALRVIP